MALSFKAALSLSAHSVNSVKTTPPAGTLISPSIPYRPAYRSAARSGSANASCLNFGASLHARRRRSRAMSSSPSRA